MKPISFTISKNALIITLIVLFGSVITYDQIKIRKQQARLELMTEQMTNLLPETNYTQKEDSFFIAPTGGVSQAQDQGLASGYQKIAESGQIPVNPFEQSALGQPPVDSIAKPFYEKPKITARTVVFNCDSVMESNKLLKKKVDYYFEYYRESIHNRYKSAFVSHEIADTITIVDCDTWESIPRYTINCDTITGDCQLKMIR